MVLARAGASGTKWSTLQEVGLLWGDGGVRLGVFAS